MMRQFWNDQKGSVTAVIGALIFLPLLWLSVGAMRIMIINGDVSSAARASARAASQAYNAGAGTDQAAAVAEDTLGNSGVSCVGGPTVTASGSWDPGGTVNVELTCEIDLSSSALAGFPGTRTVTVDSAARVDSIRGDGS